MCGKNRRKRGKYRISSGLHEKDDAIQIATIQSILGTKARRVLKTLPNIPGDITERTVEGILTALETYCVPRKNTTYERYVFRMTIQEDRSLDIFVTDLDCGAIKDSQTTRATATRDGFNTPESHQIMQNHGTISEPVEDLYPTNCTDG